MTSLEAAQVALAQEHFLIVLWSRRCVGERPLPLNELDCLERLAIAL